MENEEFKDAADPTVSSDPEMDIDLFIEKLGPCGMFQCLVIITGMFLEFSSSYQSLIMYFIGNNPSWKCAFRNSNDFCAKNFNQSFDVSNSNYNERCKMNRSDWVFSVSNKGYSIVTEYDLVCSKGYIVAIVNAAFFIGWAIGGFFTGFLSDRFGRKPCIVVGYITLSIFAITSAYTNAIWQLAILRALIGVCIGTIVAGLVTAIAEYTAPVYRTAVMVVIQTSFATSVIILAVAAMYIQDWRKLELYASFPGIVAIIISVFVPESPRWLKANGNLEKAKGVLKEIVAVNNGVLFNFKLKQYKEGHMFKWNTYTYVDLFREWSLVLFMMAQIFGWFSFGLIYYGVTLEAEDLGGNIYENLMYSMIGDIVGILLTIFACNRFGKRLAISASFGLCGVLLICIAAVPKSTHHGAVIRIILAFISKVFINIAYNGFYIWSTELFPTVVRNQGLIFCHLGNNIGSASAPFVTRLLRNVSRPLPFIIMAIFGILSGLTSLTLPETNMKATREKYEDLLGKRAISSAHESSEITPLLQK